MLLMAESIAFHCHMVTVCKVTTKLAYTSELSKKGKIKVLDKSVNRQTVKETTNECISPP